jgi:predicted O-methyltransferase YrrM
MASRDGASSANATVPPKDVERRTNVPILYNLLSLPLKLILVSLELGAGGGLVGLAVAMGCPVNHSIYITDQENMFELMAKNIVLNGLESRVKRLVLNWYGHPPK